MAIIVENRLSAGGTPLTIGPITDGEFLKRDGDLIVSIASVSSNKLVASGNDVVVASTTSTQFLDSSAFAYAQLGNFNSAAGPAFFQTNLASGSTDVLVTLRTRLMQFTPGAAATGFGSTINTELNTSTAGSQKTATRLKSSWRDATHATPSARWEVEVQKANTLTPVIRADYESGVSLDSRLHLTPCTTITVSGTAPPNSVIPVDTSGGDVTLTLSTGFFNGAFVTVVKTTAANNLVIDATVNGTTGPTITGQWSSRTFQWISSENTWVLVSSVGA